MSFYVYPLNTPSHSIHSIHPLYHHILLHPFPQYTLSLPSLAIHPLIRYTLFTPFIIISSYIHSLNTPSLLPPLSIHSLNLSLHPLSQYTLSLNTPSLSTHPLSQPTLSLNPPSLSIDRYRAIIHALALFCLSVLMPVKTIGSCVRTSHLY